MTYPLPLEVVRFFSWAMPLLTTSTIESISYTCTTFTLKYLMLLKFIYIIFIHLALICSNNNTPDTKSYSLDR